MHRRVSVFLVLLVFFVSVYTATAFYIVNPRPNQGFFGFGVFSQQGLSGYLQSSNQTVSINQTIPWQFEITNRMGSVQFVQVVSRLGNITTAAPNESTPASLAVLWNSSVFVPDGETAELNFTWKVVMVSSSGGLEFLKMSIGGDEVASSVGASSGRDFRLFFELWTFDASSGSFQYGWRNVGTRIGTWLQVGFSVGP